MVRAFRTRVPTLLDRFQPSEAAVLVGTAIVVGAGTGVGAVLFIRLIELIRHLLFDTLPGAFGGLGRGWLIVIPALGGLAAGPMITFFASEAKGHGVPEVMEAIALRGGGIRPRVVVGKVLASALCIGSGGSAGREGPIVQVGAALGSAIGQVLRLSDARMRNLVACGAAAGIAATFNAPIAGVMFAMEIIIGELHMGDLGNVVIAAVTASTLAGCSWEIGRPSTCRSSAQRPSGRYCCTRSWGWSRHWRRWALSASSTGSRTASTTGGSPMAETGVRRFATRRPGFHLPAGAGQGLRAPGRGAVGHAAGGEPAARLRLRLSHHGNRLAGRFLSLVLLLALVVLKPLATSLTLGSGNSGGVFAPLLFTGAALGGAFGDIVERPVAGATAGAGAFAMVGMATVFAGAARAPFTAILIVFEMTDDYRLIVPLMAGVIVSLLVAERLHPESIYTLKLARRGIRWQRGRDVDIMASVRVDEVMVVAPQSVPPELPVALLTGEFLRTGRHGFPVVDGDGRLFGVVSLEDYRRATADGEGHEDLTVRDIATRNVITVFPDDTVGTALRRMAPRDLSRLPVVTREDPLRVVGVVRRNDIVRAYEVGALRLGQGQPRADVEHALGEYRAEFVDVAISPESPTCGRTVAELSLPRLAVLVSIRRRRELVIPHGDTQLEAGDVVTALCMRATTPALREALNPPGD